MRTYTAVELEEKFTQLWGRPAGLIRHRIGGGASSYTIEDYGAKEVVQLNQQNGHLSPRFSVADGFWAEALAHERDAADYAEYVDNGLAAVRGVL